MSASPAPWTPAQLALAWGVALVLAVGLGRLHEIIVRLRSAHVPQPPALGGQVAAVMGRMLDDGRPEMLPDVERAVALLFLSSRCPSCRSRLDDDWLGLRARLEEAVLA